MFFFQNFDTYDVFMKLKDELNKRHSRKKNIFSLFLEKSCSRKHTKQHCSWLNTVEGGFSNRPLFNNNLYKQTAFHFSSYLFSYLLFYISCHGYLEIFNFILKIFFCRKSKTRKKFVVCFSSLVPAH